MKDIKLTILLPLLLVCSLCASGQAREAAFGCNEKLEYVVSYRAKLVPNIDAALVTIHTSCKKLDGIDVYHVVGNARALAFFRKFYDVNDTYNSWLDAQTLRPLKFNAELREGDYRFSSTIVYNWAAMQADSKYRNLKRPDATTKTLRLTPESFDAIGVFFNLRSTPAEGFTPNQPLLMRLVLEDTVRTVQYKFLGHEERNIKDFGRFRTLKFSCQLATSTGESFEDGTEFFIWISDDLNKIPLYIESPIRVGSIRARIKKFENLKYPLDSQIK